MAKRKIDIKRFVEDKLKSLNEECVWWSNKIKNSTSEEEKKIFTQDLIKVNCQQIAYSEVKSVIHFNVSQNKLKNKDDNL